MALVALGGGALLPGALDDAPTPIAGLGTVPEAEQIPPIPVRVFEYGFEPSRVVIKAGHSIVWRNIGTELHNVAPTTKAGVPVWKAAAARGTTRHLFTKPGTYPYKCTIHPQMRGVVVVRREL